MSIPPRQTAPHNDPTGRVFELSDIERETAAVAAVRVVTEELAANVSLRGRVQLATSVLAQRFDAGDPDVALVLAILDGATLDQVAAL